MKVRDLFIASTFVPQILGDEDQSPEVVAFLESLEPNTQLIVSEDSRDGVDETGAMVIDWDGIFAKCDICHEVVQSAIAFELHTI